MPFLDRPFLNRLLVAIVVLEPIRSTYLAVKMVTDSSDDDGHVLVPSHNHLGVIEYDEYYSDSDSDSDIYLYP